MVTVVPAMIVVAFSVHSAKAVIQNITGHLLTGRLAVIAGRPEVNAAKDAGILDFIESLGKAREKLPKDGDVENNTAEL